MQSLLKYDSFVLLESNQNFEENRYSYLFTEPEKVLCALKIDELQAVLAQMDELAQDFYLAGFLSYECNALSDHSLWGENKLGTPLIWLGAFREATIFDHKTAGVTGPNKDFFLKKQTDQPFELTEPQLQISSEDYQNKIAFIKREIEAGNTYQINFTDKYKFDFNGSPIDFYNQLKRKQTVAYNAFIKCRNQHILSLSPELFFRKTGQEIITKPMKGTCRRGRTTAEDAALANELANDVKNRSENIMIVDLMRNDLGRICKTGSVVAQSLFNIEKYDSLFQMTSTVAGELKPGIAYSDIFKAIFPCGSVTGAPKLSSMKIIHRLEEEQRGIYTGAIGFTSPEGAACFNVPIRTLTLVGEYGEMGVGSGVVYDSGADSEYEECKLKANFLTEEGAPFSLIETLLWQNSYQRLEDHLSRLLDSAKYFNFRVNIDEINRKLIALAKTLRSTWKYKVRLLNHKNGEFDVACSELNDPAPPNPLVAISKVRVNSGDRFLFHKTTNRRLYDEEFAKSREEGFFDILFLNENGEVTEGAISNLFVEKNKQLYTPPIQCGLLNGTVRAAWLKTKQNASEKVLHIQDLAEADAIYLTNSVRGMTKVEL